MTPADRKVTLYHAVPSRSAGALALLEELGADYELHLLDLKKGESRQPAYLAVNPMGKVPAIRHQGQLVSEQGAVYLYLAELYPEAGLAPAVGDPLRGAFLRWLFFYGSSFEPALIDRAMKREPAAMATSPYGTGRRCSPRSRRSSRAAPGWSASVSPPPTCCGATPCAGP